MHQCWAGFTLGVLRPYELSDASGDAAHIGTENTINWEEGGGFVLDESVHVGTEQICHAGRVFFTEAGKLSFQKNRIVIYFREIDLTGCAEEYTIFVLLGKANQVTNVKKGFPAWCVCVCVCVCECVIWVVSPG